MGLPCLAFDEVYTLWHENGTLPQALETAPALRAFPPTHTHPGKKNCTAVLW